MEDEREKPGNEDLCRTAVYYYAEYDRRVPATHHPRGAYLCGRTICSQGGYVPPITTGRKSS